MDDGTTYAGASLRLALLVTRNLSYWLYEGTVCRIERAGSGKNSLSIPFLMRDL